MKAQVRRVREELRERENQLQQAVEAVCFADQRFFAVAAERFFHLVLQEANLDEAGVARLMADEARRAVALRDRSRRLQLDRHVPAAVEPSPSRKRNRVVEQGEDAISQAQRRAVLA